MTKEELEQSIERTKVVLRCIQESWCDWSKAKQDENYPKMMDCINYINRAELELYHLNNPGPVGRAELKA